MSIITVRLREIVDPDGSRARSLHVFCPRRLASIAPTRCAPCGYRCPPDPSVEVASGDSGPLAVAARVHAGAASSQHIVCVREGTPLATIHASVRGVRAFALPVVDARDALVGAIARSEIAAAADDPVLATITAGELARPTFAVHESAHVDEAIGHMTAHHLRVVPIVDAENRVIGLLSDIDVLRWIARGAPQRWRSIG